MLLSGRDLVTCGLSVADRRVTEVTLTACGRQAPEEAAPGHVDLVQRLFFGGLPAGLAGPFSEALESGSVSGSFRNALDWLILLADHDPPYLSNKPIGLVSTAGGCRGLQAVNSMDFIARALAWLERSAGAARATGVADV